MLENYAYARIDNSVPNTPLLELSPESVGTFPIYILGITVSGKHIYMPVNQIIECGLRSQEIFVNEELPLVIEVDKNEGIREILSS